MSSDNKDTQEGIASGLNTLSKSLVTGGVDKIYPSPPNTPPRTKLNSSPNGQAEREFEDERFPSRTPSPSILLTPPSQPSSEQSNSTTEEEQPSKDKFQMDASTLQTRLELADLQCGCPTKTRNDRPCERHILKGNRSRVSSLIGSMVALTQSSPELDAKLDELFGLARCYTHRNEYLKKEARISTWKVAFPSAVDANFKQTVAVQNEIREALGPASTQCIWSTPEDNRPCNKGIGGQRVHNCVKTIDEIVQPMVYLDDVRLGYFLQVLEANMYCPNHIENRCLQMAALWKSKVIEIRTKANLESAQPADKEMPEGHKSQTRPQNTSETGRLSSENSNRTISLNPNLSASGNLTGSHSPEFHHQDPAAYWPIAYDTTPFHITYRRKSGSVDYKRLREKMEAELKGKDEEDGYVYLYQVEGNEEFVKIGYTGRSVEIRHKEWAFNCNRNIKCLYPILDSVVAVPHARRVEALCHAELHHRRITIDCSGCLKPHTELFEISPTEAILVVEKWVTWMKTCPYQSELGSEVIWTLKRAEKNRVHDMDRFMEDISAAAQSTVSSILTPEIVKSDTSPSPST
jgi:hypothetical protein